VYTALAFLCGSVARLHYHTFSILCSIHKNGLLYCGESFEMHKKIKKRLDNFEISCILIEQHFCAYVKQLFMLIYTFCYSKN
jgi:hypothetical protein